MKYFNFSSNGIVLSFALFTVLTSVSCSTAQVSVLPGEEYNRVVSKDIESDDAEEEAVKAANKYCKERGKEAIFIGDQETKYTGQMNEGTRKNIRNASKAGMILGGTGATLGRGGTQSAGAILGTAGTVGHVMTSDRDYKSELRFKCR